MKTVDGDFRTAFFEEYELEEFNDIIYLINFEKGKLDVFKENIIDFLQNAKDFCIKKNYKCQETNTPNKTSQFSKKDACVEDTKEVTTYSSLLKSIETIISKDELIIEQQINKKLTDQIEILTNTINFRQTDGQKTFNPTSNEIETSSSSLKKNIGGALYKIQRGHFGAIHGIKFKDSKNIFAKKNTCGKLENEGVMKCSSFTNFHEFGKNNNNH